MAGLHGSRDVPVETESAAVQSRRARLGQILFFAYSTLYLGYVLLNAFAVSTIEQTHLFGVNLAVNYGLALIVIAFVLAVVYEILCRRLAARAPAHPEDRG